MPVIDLSVTDGTTSIVLSIEADLPARELVNAAAVTADTALRATTPVDTVTLRNAAGEVVAEHPTSYVKCGAPCTGACDHFCQHPAGHDTKTRHRQGDVSW